MLCVVVVVLCDWILDVEVFDCIGYVFCVVFEWIFWCMYVDYDEFLVVIFLILVVYVWDCMNVVDV